jgi:hypothetical protein
VPGVAVSESVLTPLSSESSLEEKLKYLRDLGWNVAVHNDYRQRGTLHTFWLFTCSGVEVHAEGPVEHEVEIIDSVLRQVYSIELDKRLKKISWVNRFHGSAAATPAQAESIVNRYVENND